MKPLAKNIKRYFSLKELIIVTLAIVISISAGIVVFLDLKKDVIISEGGQQIEVKTMKTTVREVFEQNRISVKPEDFVSVSLDARLQKMAKNEIYIKRAVPISIIADGQETQILTYRDTVGEALQNSPITLDPLDKIDGLSREDKIVQNMNIRIVRVQEKELVEQISIPFKVVNRENSRLDKGTENVLREGIEGTREKSFKVVFEDGKEVARELLKDVIAANPIDKIIELGTVLTHKNARGEVLRYKNVLDMTSTAYTASFNDTGKNPGDPYFGITATGTKAAIGTIAVDPRVIPLGTRVYVEVAGSTPDYGFAKALDTGGAIKGNIIDLYLDSESAAMNWGRKNVKVYILMD